MPETYNIDIEEAYLGGLLIDPELIITEPLEEKDFFIHKNRYIYRACEQTFRKHGVLDLMLIAEQLEANGHLAEVGGIGSVARLMNATPTALHTPQYASEIRKKAENREFINIASEIAGDASKNQLEPAKYIEKMTKAIRTNGQTDNLTNIAHEYQDYVKRREENPSDVWGIPTPWNGFNKVTGGLHRGEAVMFYGDSGLGKTTMVLQIGFHAAAHQYKVDFYELEMTSANLFGRLVSMKSQVPTRNIHTGLKDSADKVRVRDAIDFVRGLPIRISDSTHWTSTEIRADQQKKGADRADVVIVDYLALLNDNADNDYIKVERAAKNLRQMAKDLDQVLLNVASDVKDGSIKGTKEVKFSQDEIWHLKRESESLLDRVRILEPNKRRNDGEIGKIELVMKLGLPFFEEI